MTDAERIAEIQARWEGVGPWSALRVDEGQGCKGYSIEGQTPSGQVAWADLDDRGLDWDVVRQLAECIAVAPQDIARLLARVAELEAAQRDKVLRAEG